MFILFMTLSINFLVIIYVFLILIFANIIEFKKLILLKFPVLLNYYVNCQNNIFS